MHVWQICAQTISLAFHSVNFDELLVTPAKLAASSPALAGVAGGAQHAGGQQMHGRLQELEACTETTS